MTNFWTLPKQLREKIYRLHLVQEEPINLEEFWSLCGLQDPRSLLFVNTTSMRWQLEEGGRIMPQLLQLSKATEREAAPLFFGENVFNLMHGNDIHAWKKKVWPRHLKLIRSVAIGVWQSPQIHGLGNEAAFKALGSLKGLQSLTLGVDEQIALERYLESHPSIKWHHSLGFGAQVQLHSLQFHGINALRSIRQLRHVEFVPALLISTSTSTAPSLKRHEVKGALVGGELKTSVRREMMRSRQHKPYNRRGCFRFFDLPPEIRTMIYEQLLVFAGVTYPSPGMPTSVTGQYKMLTHAERTRLPVPHTALAVLQTNRQFHDEAAGIFYDQNHFVLSHPSHLLAFALSLENGRLNSISSVTLFHKDHTEDGIHSIDSALRLLSRKRGLKKFHLLVEDHMSTHHSSAVAYRPRPIDIRGVRTLFTLRGVADIKVRDLKLEADLMGTDRHDLPANEIQANVLKHFNHGLALAQQGRVVEQLYTNREWCTEEVWPALGDAGSPDCGRSAGCSCGGSDGGEGVARK